MLYFSEHYQLYVPESAQVGSAVGKIKATDADIGSNADMKYSIINGDGSGIFSISTDKETREGIISLKKVSKIIAKYFFVNDIKHPRILGKLGPSKIFI